MVLTTSNYFDSVKHVDFSKLPEALRKAHDITTRVGKSGNPWENYNASAPIRAMIDTYFEKMGVYLDQQAPKAAKPKVDKKAASKPATASSEKTTKAQKAAPPKRPCSPPEQTPSGVQYFNSKGKLVTDKTGEIDAESLYYVQPDGSYEKGGDRRSPGWVTPPRAKAKKPKAPRAKKAKPADIRSEVPHFEADVAIIRQFAALTKKAENVVTIANVRNLNRRVQKAIVSLRVRKTSPHAALLRGIATVLPKAVKKMHDANIGTVDKLDFSDSSLVKLAREVAAGTKVSDAVNLLSRFINLQGTKPEQKTVEALLKSLEKEKSEHPKSDYASSIGLAVAMLKDWQPGTAVKLSAQQLAGLQGLSGLGCACQEAAAKKAGR